MNLKLVIIGLVVATISIGCFSSKKTASEKVAVETTEVKAAEPAPTPKETPKAPVVHKSPTGAEMTAKRLKQSQEAMATYPDSLFALVQRTSCYGRCPTYSIKIYKSGYVEYKGVNWVEHKGNYNTRLSKQELATIDKKIESSHFYDFEDIYDTQVTDFPSLICYVNHNGEKKRVLDRSASPEEFKAYAKFIDDLIDHKVLNLMK